MSASLCWLTTPMVNPTFALHVTHFVLRVTQNGVCITRNTIRCVYLTRSYLLFFFFEGKILFKFGVYLFIYLLLIPNICILYLFSNILHVISGNFEKSDFVFYYAYFTIKCMHFLTHKKYVDSDIIRGLRLYPYLSIPPFTSIDSTMLP